MNSAVKLCYEFSQSVPCCLCPGDDAASEIPSSPGDGVHEVSSLKTTPSSANYSVSQKKKKKVNDFLERKQALLGPCIPPKGKQTEQVCALHFLFNCTILFPLRTWIGGWKKQRVLQSCVCWVGALHCWGSALEASQTDQLQINLYPLQAYLAPAPHRLCSTLFSPNCFNLSIYFFQAVQLRMRFPWHSSVTASWWLCATRGHAVLCVCLKPF